MFCDEKLYEGSMPYRTRAMKTTIFSRRGSGIPWSPPAFPLQCHSFPSEVGSFVLLDIDTLYH
jgi:hypothetical protein